MFLGQQAILLTAGYHYIGASGDINVWNPNVDLPDDFTTAQIWLLAGPGNKFESVESGWMVCLSVLVKASFTFSTLVFGYLLRWLKFFFLFSGEPKVIWR